MKILFLTHRVPYPPNKGDKLRAFNILKYLSKNYSISLLCLADNAEDLNYGNELRKYCKSVNIIPINKFWAKMRSLFCLFSKLPLTLAYFYSRKLKKLVKEKVESENFDVIFIYSSSMAQYALGINGIPKIMDFIDVDSDKWGQYAQYAKFPQKIIYKVEQRRLKRYEEIIANSVEHCIVTSKIEAEVFRSFIPGMQISAISNGVNFEYFKPNSFNYEEKRLIFTGQMDYFANVDGILYFNREILPLIKKKIANVKLYIVGNKPAKDIVNLAKEDVVITGFVEDVRSYIQKSAVCVVPLRIARGIQNKILEAMSMGVPVVTTSQACQGIDVCPGEDIFIEDSPEGFANRVIDLLKDRDLRKQMAMRGRKTIEAKFKWNKNLEQIDKILQKICNEDR